MATIVESEINALTNSLEQSNIDDISNRHRREKKELQAKIQELKKNAPKSDKKKRKQTMEEVVRLETELEIRHAAELQAAQSINDDEFNELNVLPTETDNVQTEQPSQRISKAQKRRDKKSKEARDREENIRAAIEADDGSNAPKTIELKLLLEKLKERKLALYNIPSDGDCLYNAIRHQLEYHGLGAYSVKNLRNKTANYIIANKDTLIFYMTDQSTGDLLNEEQFIEYCEVVRSTSAWGGQVELKALSTILEITIEVIQAEGPSTIHGTGPAVTITYHRHLYSLGEHYNSTISWEDKPNEEENLDNDC